MTPLTTHDSRLTPSLFDGPTLRPGTWRWGQLQPYRYGLIMADPPWAWDAWSDKGREKSPEAHYRTMTLADIAALPVADLATRDCLLWLWATAPMLDQQIGILGKWGFRFVTSGVWVKRTARSGGLAFGTGYVLRNCHEPFLIGALGEPKCARDVRSVVEGVVGGHSRKPDAAFRAAERLLPGVARVELFAREVRPGWDGWGDEYGNGES